MQRKLKMRTFAAVIGLMILLLSSPLWADHFRPLSTNHTSYGVSQFTYGNIPGREFSSIRPAIKLMNPVHVTQVVAAIIYEGDRGFNPGTAEVFILCVVKKLNPHASVGITELEIDTPASRVPKYGELIWAPVEKVNLTVGLRLGQGQGLGRGRPNPALQARIADGLGGAFDTGAGNREGPSRLANPVLFSLPSDDVVPGQRQDAIDCVLDGLTNLGLSLEIFEEFGIE